MKLLKNLYAYAWQGNDNNCNSYLITNSMKSSRHILVDPGHITTPFLNEPGLSALIKQMEADGIDAKQIGLIILTHSHRDHCEAAAVIREQNDAIVALNKAEEEYYKEFGGEVDMYLQQGKLALAEENQTRFEIIHSPGHSPGHITLHWPEQKVLIAGDVIFYHSSGRVDLPGGNAAELQQSIQRLSGLDIEYLLCGHSYGHSGIIQGKEAVKENFDFVKRTVLPYL